MDPIVLVSLVTYNHENYVSRCIDSIRAQTYPALRIVAVDNASSDGTIATLKRCLPADSLIVSSMNKGYSGGHNLAMATADSEFVLCINPDVILDPGFVRSIVADAETESAAGSFTGRIYRVTAGEFGRFSPDAPLTRKQIDTTGVFPKLLGTHFDRGHGTVPLDDWVTRRGLVFGASGCAAMYRRTALRDVAVNGEVFDEDLFAYFEDVDLAWRLQLRGWRCRYVPEAVAFHVRANSTSSSLLERPPEVIRYLARNRWLVAVKDFPAPILAFKAPVMLLRDISQMHRWLSANWAMARGSLDAIKLLPRMISKRRKVMARRKVGNGSIFRWFSSRAVKGLI